MCDVTGPDKSSNEYTGGSLGVARQMRGVVLRRFGRVVDNDETVENMGMKDESKR